LLERLEKIPGIEAAGVIKQLPLGYGSSSSGMWLEGREGTVDVQYCRASADYFKALRIPLRRGRYFGRQESPSGPLVVMVSESLARQLWPKEDPIGKKLRDGREQGQGWREVVGVVGDVRSGGLRSEPSAILYFPYQQDPRWMWVIARTTVDPISLQPAIGRVVREVIPYSVTQFDTLESMIGQTLGLEKTLAFLSLAFAVLALVIAATGLYGVVAYTVTQRRYEIGIRMALGADQANIRRLVLGMGLRLILPGLIAGCCLAFALCHILASQLFAIAPDDPWTYVIVATLLAAVALTACWIPARRASKIDPMAALRYE
jgi:predicted permease